LNSSASHTATLGSASNPLFMKMPKFILRVGGRDFVVPHNRGVATIMSVLADAVPVDVDLHAKSPTITLEFEERPDLASYVTEVRCVKIPRNVVWQRKTKSGEVEEIRPVTKEPKALPAPRSRQLPGRKRPALTNGSGAQLALGY
jgi:hypothetical protein